MAAGQDSEAIIATLEEAKVKLGEAQRHTFAGLTRLGKIRSAIEFTLGRLGRGNPAITLLRDAEKSIKDRAIEINALSARVDKAIAEIREAAGGGGNAPSPSPAPSDAVPVSLPRTYPVMPGNTPILVHNAFGEIPWSSGQVSSAARSLDQGAASITVGSRAQAEELLLGKFQGAGYRNASGFDGKGTRQYFGEKRGTYHWDDQLDADGRVVGHGPGNKDGALPHLQIHTLDGPIVRIFWEP